MTASQITQTAPLDPSWVDAREFGGTLEASDPRWLQLTKKIDTGDYVGSARLAMSLYDEGCHDPLLLGYYLFGCYEEAGPVGLAPVLEALASALTGSESGSPRADGRTSEAATWLLKRLLRTLERPRSAGGLEPDSVLEPEDLARRDRVINGLAAAVEGADASLQAAVSRLAVWWQDNRPEPPQESIPEVTLVPAPDEAETRVPEEPVDDPRNETELAAVPEISRITRTATSEAAPGAAPWLDLIERLRTFELLAAREDWLRAAILAADIESRLAQFDPRHYFPDLLAPFYKKRAATGDTLDVAPLQCGDGTRQALEELCRMDLGAFGECHREDS